MLSLSLEGALRTREYPAFESDLEIAAPIPLVAPVMTATLPAF
jgi:hypothetical protein